MKAIKTDRAEKFMSSYRKENLPFESYNMIVPSRYDAKNGVSCVDLRIYFSKNCTYSAIWVRDINGNFKSGTGKAGGWGYHRGSAAAHEAIINAGYDLENSISGVGESAIIEAVQALAITAGYPDAIFFHAHA